MDRNRQIDSCNSNTHIFEFWKLSFNGDSNQISNQITTDELFQNDDELIVKLRTSTDGRAL